MAEGEGGQVRAQSAPGHGRYDTKADSLLGLSHIRASPKWSMKGRYHETQQMEGPGPGAYGVSTPEQSSRFGKSPRFAFGMSGREAVNKAKVPGPGQYSDTRGIGMGAKYTLTPRRQGKASTAREYPGPGAHEIRSTIGPQGNAPKYSAAARKGDEKKVIGPGPGEYDKADSAMNEKSPMWGFGTSQRADAAAGGAGTPGPGAYVRNTTTGEGPKFSMKARLAGPRPDISPGPGAHGGHYTTFA
mmetsp:Transcript_37980/g.80750  ORF Transcript_37980/g.80750 Transcript_37980/m.80750 type:complete len:244 (-) Transcript_37980:50-781(-)